MRPILAGLRRLDQRPGLTRRLLAGLGCLALLLALAVIANPVALLALGLAGVCLTGWALFAGVRCHLGRFAAVNVCAVVILAWGAAERTDLAIDRTPGQVSVALNGTRLTASLPELASGAERVAVSVGASDERPVAAPWIYAALPPLTPLGNWLDGGMRGGARDLRITDEAGADLVAPISALWQPAQADGPPLVSVPADEAGGWEVVRSDDGGVLLLSPPISAATYQVSVPMVRPSGAVQVSLLADASGGAVEVTAAADRRLLEIAARPPDGPAETLVGGPFVYRRGIANWLQTLAREIGRSWLVALALVALARFLALPFAVRLPRPPAVASNLALAGVGVVLALGTFGLAGLIAVLVLDGIPHTVESIAYLFQAQIFALGGLWAPAPPLAAPFEQAYLVVHDGRWFSALPPGQSVLLAAGLMLGAVWLVSPLLTALAVGLTVLLGRLTYGWSAGALAGLLLLFSPFVLLLSGDMLAHPAGLFWSVLVGLGVALGLQSHPRLGWLLAGLGTGGLVTTRPLAAVGIGIPLTLYLLWCSRRDDLPVVWRRAQLWVLGAAPGVLFMGYVNLGLTGSAFAPAFSLWSEVDRFGFGPGIGTRGGHDLASALGNTWANVAVLLRHLYGWPSYLTLALALVPFVLGARSRWDRVFLLWTGGLAAAHLLYWSDGIVYGPRFTFESVAALALLTARGATLLARADGLVPLGGGVLSAPTGPAADAAPITEHDIAADPEARRAALDRAARAERGLSAIPVAATLLALLVGINVVGYLPDLVLAYRDYNGISRARLALVEEAGLDNALVFVTSEWPDWQSYGQVFPANGPLLDGPVVYARDLGDAENARLMSRYPDRQYWLLRDLQLTEIRR